MGALFLSEADVSELLDVRQAIEVVDEALRRMAAGEAENVPRVRARAGRVMLHSMIAAADYLGVVGWKCYCTTRAAATFHVALYDRETGRMSALIEANRLGQLRTGATTAVALRAMAPHESGELGLFGAGWQAEMQLEAAAAVLKLERAFVYSRTEARRTDFAERMQRRLNLEVVPVDRPQEAASELPIVITATTSIEPVFDGQWLDEGTVVCAIGSNAPGRAEIDAHVVRRADVVVCDQIAACQAEAGDFVDALEKGIFDWRRAVELSDVLVGKAVGRTRSGGIALFKSVGLAIEDVALAAHLITLARRAKRGVELPL